MLLLVTILLPIILGVIASFVKADMPTRKRCYTGILFLTDILALLSIMEGKSITPVVFSDNLSLSFTLDEVGKYFLLAIIAIYTCVCFYAYEYMNHEERPNIFFCFFFISFGALISVAMAANLITLYFCFEMVTLMTVPLVLHDLTKEAVAAGLKYLFYSVAGALLGLLAVFFVYHFTTGDASFVYGGFIDTAKVSGHEPLFLAVIFLGILGFGTKAGMYPMHGWLPTAHPIAPAPASALLSGIVAKAGVIAIIRLIYFSVGTELIRGTWVQYTWMSLCLLTIFMGSMMAYREKVMKRRLAFSTVSQISYILLGLSFLSEEGLEGGLLHLMGHMFSKGCLFLVAGIFIVQLGIRKVEDLKGIGKRMPITMLCFTAASLSLVGIPPMAGFLSKWYIASAAIDSGLMPFAIIAPVVLLISALLTAGYLLTVVVDAFFPGHEGKEAELRKAEPPRIMWIPLVFLCAGALLIGIAGPTILTLFGL